MKFINLPIITLILLFLLNGCGTFQYPSIHNVDPRNLKSNESIFIVSSGASETCRVEASYVLVKSGEEKISLFPLNNGFSESMFDDEYGLVFTMILPPGDYEFWHYAGHPYVNDEYPLTNSITIKPQEIKYIGEFYAFGACGNPSVSIRDRRKRDIDRVILDAPNLNVNSIIIDIVELNKNSKKLLDIKEILKNKLNVE